jgi:hypothetical protein
LTAGTCRNCMSERNAPLPSEIFSNLNKYILRGLYIGHRVLETVKLVLNINLDRIPATCHRTNITVILDQQPSKKHAFSGHACFCQHKKFKITDETYVTARRKRFAAVQFLVLQFF